MNTFNFKVFIKNIIIGCFFLFILILPSVASAARTPGATAYWPIKEDAGLIISDQGLVPKMDLAILPGGAVNIAFLSGAQNGILFSSACSSCQTNLAINDFKIVNTIQSAGNTGFTFDVWYKPLDLSITAPIIASSQASSLINLAIIQDKNDVVFTGIVKKSSLVNYYEIDRCVDCLFVNTRYYIGFSMKKDGVVNYRVIPYGFTNSSEITAYLDGTFVDSNQNYSTWDATWPFHVGSYSAVVPSFGGMIKGEIYQLAFYDKALTPVEMADNYFAGYRTIDLDGDGYASIADGGLDCDDNNPSRHPGLADTCQTLNFDDDCDGSNDEDDPLQLYYRDEDGDGKGNISVSGNQCLSSSPEPTKWVLDSTDCDDANKLIWQNIDGWKDADGDTYGSNFIGKQPVCSGVALPVGYVNKGGDCDDTVATGNLIYPGATEICDGIDNDCDTPPTSLPWVDEGYKYGGVDIGGACSVGTGECLRNGMVECATVASTKCSASPGPSVSEVCDGLDNDCNGTIDNGVQNSCGGCGVIPAIENPGLTCDGADADLCKDGSWACNVAKTDTTCNDNAASIVEVCDGLDNDCNGVIDNGVQNSCGGCGVIPAIENPGLTCDGADVDSCKDGVWVCNIAKTATSCNDNAASGVEICDGLDNDCNGVIDNGVQNACGGCGVLVSAPGTACDGTDTDSCSTGQWVCNVAKTAVTCNDDAASTVEVCNGVDDNCDGAIDEALLNTCGGCGVIPATEAQGLTCDGADADSCATGVWTCNVAKTDTTCSDDVASIVEVCDGVDNDCNGVIDNGVQNSCGGCGVIPATENSGLICDGADVDICKDGVWVCNVAKTATTCDDNPASGIEVCNGIDDNCDGTVDEGVKNSCGGCGMLTSVPGTACDGTDTDSCSTGQWVCNVAKTAVTCNDDAASTVEVCDGADNDCDGDIDENKLPEENCATPADDDCDGKVNIADSDCVPKKPPVVKVNSPFNTKTGKVIFAFRKQVVQLDATKSYDPDGGNLTYAWTVESTVPPGTPYILSNANIVNPTFTVLSPDDAVITLKITGTDDDTPQASSSDIVTIVVSEDCRKKSR